MFWFKTLTLGCFECFLKIAARLGFAGAAIVLSAQELPLIDHVERYALLDRFLKFEKGLEKPVVDALHANIPCVFSGFDAAPFMIAAVLAALWIALELEAGYLARLRWAIESRRRLEEQRDSTEERLEAERKKAERVRERALAHEREESRRQSELLREAVRAREREDALTLARQAAAEAEAAQRNVREPMLDAPVAGGSDRERLLELYAQTKKTLEEQKKNLSFLAIDVVNSTGMKQNEDAALAERDFRQYRKLVERIIASHNGLKTAWTPDGVMICFSSVQNAVQAAQDIIRNLEHFNRNVKSIKADFKVRCGINAGQVLFDDSVRMEEMTDRSIDIAGHMQKYAAANTIFIGAQAIEGMRAQYGFQPANKEVDGCQVFQWRPDDKPDALPA